MPDQETATRGGRRHFLRQLGVAAAGATALGANATQPVPRADVRRWDETVDVLIVGSGAAGMAAAIEARRQGATALVLEKFQVPGGSSSLSGGVCYLGGGTPLQKALGYDDTVEEMYKYMMAAAGIYAPADKIQLYCEHSLDHFQWMIDNGVKYANRFSAEKELSHGAASLYYSGSEKYHPFNEIARPAPRGHVPPAQNQTGGRELMKLLLASAQRLGAVVRVNASCEQLVRETDGSISGAVVEQGGERRHIRARGGVVLAAGGFIHNPEMLKRYAPELFPCSPHWGRAGDLGMGIRMGMGAGGAVANMNQGFAVLPLYPPDNVLQGIMVNRLGQRFINEDVYYGVAGHEVVYHQQGRGYFIVDADCDYPMQDWRLTLAATADSIEALETQLKLPVGVLQQTVDYYNRYAAKKQDPLLHKSADFLAPLRKPPFKAYDLAVDKAFYAVHTFGGLQTSVDAQVLNPWGEPIPGLYATGRTSAGLPVAPYNGSGLSIGDCTFFGRRAGVHAAGRRQGTGA